MAECSNGNELQEKGGAASKGAFDELKGVEWNLSTLRLDTGKKRTPEDPHTLRFDTDSTFKVKLAVNRCFGSFRILEEGRISFETPSCTEKCCDPSISKDLVRALESVEHYGRKKGRLLLRGSEVRIEFEEQELEER